MKSGSLFICATIFLFLASSCVSAPQKTQERQHVPEEKKLSIKEQEKKAFEIFDRILNLTQDAEDRQAILPQIEILYEEIISKYPDVPIVEECYFRLITMSIEEFKPPKIEKAERLYQDFLTRYPESPLKIYMEQSFGQYYHSNKIWDRLLRLFTPQVKKFIKTGKLDNPYHMFMYSEAKFNLGDLVEAEKGYKIVIEFFPKTGEARLSKDRLEEIQRIKKQVPQGSSSGGA